MSAHRIDRRRFLSTAICSAVAAPHLLRAAGESIGQNRPLLEPVHDLIICPWSARHPRHDHQLILPLDDQRLLFVWCEYYAVGDNPVAEIGQVGVGDELPCQISRMISTDNGRTWGDRQVLQANDWEHNVKHPNLVRLSDTEILFSYVGWDSDEQRNVYLRRSLDNGRTWGQQIQVSEPGWYCNNADRAIRLSTGRVLLPAHGPYDERYIGGSPYRGGNLHSFIFYSDDGFRTWKRSSDSITAPGRGCHEPTIIERKDGRLFSLLRNSNGRQYISISEDGGDHWTKPVPSVLPSPESPAIMKRIPSTGDLLVIWNNVASSENKPRRPLTAAISRDEGETWINFRDIDNRTDHDAAYPSVSFIGDEAFVTYYSRSDSWKRDTEITLRIYPIERFYG